MAVQGEMRLVAVYDTDREARDAVRALGDAGVPVAQARVGDEHDHLAAVRGEMRSETVSSVAGPGTGPLTKEMARGFTLGIVLGGLIGLIVALPFAAITFGSMVWWTRLVTVAVVGIVVGSTIGAIVAAGFAARRPDEPLAAEAGVTVAVPLSDAAHTTLLATHPRRMDIVAFDDHAMETVAEEPRHDAETVHDITRHLRTERREDG